MRKILFPLLMTFAFLVTSCGETTISGDSSTTIGDSNTSLIDTSPTSSLPSENPTSNPSDPSIEDSSDIDVDPDSIIVPDQLTIHYKNDADDYEGMTFWLWSDSKTPNKTFDADGIDENGMYLTFNPKIDLGEAHSKVGIIIREKKGWSDKQTLDSFVNYGKFPPHEENGKYVLEVFCTLNSKKTLDIVASAEEASKDKVKDAKFKSDLSGIDVITSGPIKEYKLYAYDYNYYSLSPVEQKKDEIKRNYLIKEDSFTSEDITSFNISISDVKINRNYTIESIFYSSPTSTSSYIVSYENIYSSNVFSNLYYDGDDLGVTILENSTTFKIWSPVSARITLNLYKYGNTSQYMDFVFNNKPFDFPYETYDLSVDSNGVWSITLPKNLHKVYYTYTVNNFLGENEIVDPYAKAAGLNGMRGMIIDFDNEELKVDDFEALPDVWDQDPIYDIDSAMDLVVSEIHVRDLTMDSSWSSNEEDQALKGTYKGFIKEGTTYSENNVSVKTGFDHLEEYGINAVQLLPIFDQDNGEIDSEYNWGYNPLNYNVLEGSYSLDPKHGEVRIKEFKELVAAFANNDNHTRIIMDVVYNHVANANNSNFNLLVPYYYFRMTESGGFSNGSGCGNEFKTESLMGRKFIVDSFKFWAKTYKIKGFRLDLMGLYDIETLKEVKEELYAIDPDIVIYGEGWTGGGTTLDSELQATTSNVYKHLHNDGSNGLVGGFNDSGRNAIRGGNDGGWGSDNKYPGYGFISQGASDLGADKKQAVADMMRGISTGNGANPKQTVNYASCHDNYTLFDQLYWTLSDDGGVTPPNEETVAKASVAVNTMVIMANGISFINGGEEIFRTKIEDAEEVSDYEVDMYGKRISHNSYCSSDFTNSYKYNRKIEFLDYFNMYKEAIQIRKNLLTVEYDENCISDGSGPINTWDTQDGTKIGVYRKGKDGSAYVILLNARTDSAIVGSGEQTSLIFNNSSNTPTYNPSGYELDKYNVVIFNS